ncbi:hypothetical protein GCM10020367_44540 [Streptomyces sannanensis]|uniref:Peptidase S1 domain-containing protein n=1 Tax=Streptomyces sannanensis TaxID=285536 RepID=A0ABP6SG42_9ACTN
MTIFRKLPAAAISMGALAAGLLAPTSAHAIVGGAEAQSDVPWMVQFHVTEKATGKKHVCAGAAVTSRKVVTAASCLGSPAAHTVKMAAGLNRLLTDAELTGYPTDSAPWSLPVTPCTGDEGGPLVVGGRLVGIYSHGAKDCVAKDGHAAFTKASAFMGEINARVNDANLSQDDKADLFAMTPQGRRYTYYSTGAGLAAPKQLPTLAKPYTRFRQADLDRDGNQDYVYRTSDGSLYWEHCVCLFDGSGIISDWYTTKIGSGWNSMRSITVPGDLTGDGKPDLVAVDGYGVQWTYPGKGNGYLGTRIKTATGWGGYTVFGSGDYSNDGKADLLTRDSAGRLWLHKGRGSATQPFATRVQVGTGWNFTAYVATGDTTGDGKADIFVRDSSGTLWCYPGRGSATEPFRTRFKVGTGWNAYSLLG